MLQWTLKALKSLGASSQDRLIVLDGDTSIWCRDKVVIELDSHKTQIHNRFIERASEERLTGLRTKPGLLGTYRERDRTELRAVMAEFDIQEG